MSCAQVTSAAVPIDTSNHCDFQDPTLTKSPQFGSNKHAVQRSPWDSSAPPVAEGTARTRLWRALHHPTNGLIRFMRFWAAASLARYTHRMPVLPTCTSCTCASIGCMQICILTWLHVHLFVLTEMLHVSVMCYTVYTCMYICTYVHMYVCICTYASVYICTYAYMYMYVRVYMYICTYVYTCTYVHMYICTYVHMYIYVCVYMYICTYVYMYVHVCVYMSICTCVCTCIHVHRYICTYVHMYICMYVCMYVCT